MSDHVQQIGSLERCRTLTAELSALLEPLTDSVAYPGKDYVFDATSYLHTLNGAIDDALRCVRSDAALAERIEAAITKHLPPE